VLLTTLTCQTPIFYIQNTGLVTHHRPELGCDMYVRRKMPSEYIEARNCKPVEYTYALDNKGVALNNLGNYTGAILYFDKALAIDPNYVSALNGKGVALNNLGNYTGAILYFDKALAIDPKNTYALDNKAAILDRLGSYTTTGNATKFLEYGNSTNGIKMQYPSDWRVEGASSSSIIASFYPQRDYRSNIIIQIKNLTTNYTPDQYLNSLMRGIKQTTRIFRI
jgi:tetratricopeptide (TPR) repeat protein